MFKGCKNIDCMKRSLSLYGDNCQAVQTSLSPLEFSEIRETVQQSQQQQIVQVQLHCQKVEQKLQVCLNQQQLEFQQAKEEIKELQQIINKIYDQLELNNTLKNKIFDGRYYSEESKIQVLRNRIIAADRYLRNDVTFTDQQLENATTTLGRMVSESQIDAFIEKQNQTKTENLKKQLLEDKYQENTRENTGDLDLVKVIEERRQDFRVSESINGSQSSQNSQIQESYHQSIQNSTHYSRASRSQSDNIQSQNLLQLQQSLNVMTTPMVGTYKSVSIDENL